MTKKYLLLTALFSVCAFAACGEPKRTPDGHLMERPKMSAYGPDDVTKHDKNAADDQRNPAEDKK